MVKKVALPINNTFIVIALDFTVTLLIADIEYGTIKQKNIVKINESFPSLRANRLSKLQINTVLCGAVSDPLSIMIWHCGIEIFPGLTGNADQVLKGFIKGQLVRFHAPDFLPGFRRCCGFRNRGRFRGGKAW